MGVSKDQARRKGTKGVKVSRAPRVLGAPRSPSLKNTEKDVSDGFLLTSNMHKIHYCWVGRMALLHHKIIK